GLIPPSLRQHRHFLSRVTTINSGSRRGIYMARNTSKPGPAPIGAVQPNHLVDQVLSALRVALENEVYKPGDKLPSEARLAAEFGVGRSTVREALRVLSHLGLVETWSGKGTFVV